MLEEEWRLMLLEGGGWVKEEREDAREGLWA